MRGSYCSAGSGRRLVVGEHVWLQQGVNGCDGVRMMSDLVRVER